MTVTVGRGINEDTPSDFVFLVHSVGPLRRNSLASAAF
jgi:hypothetical protein